MELNKLLEKHLDQTFQDQYQKFDFHFMCTELFGTLVDNTLLCLNLERSLLVIFRPLKWGRNIIICDAFFYYKFCQNSTLSPLH